jgi:hypothetical protein
MGILVHLQQGHGIHLIRSTVIMRGILSHTDSAPRLLVLSQLVLLKQKKISHAIQHVHLTSALT